VLVGFAAETGDLVARAAAKLRRKHLDLIVANDVSQADAGFEVDTNRAVLLDSSGSVDEQPLQTKHELADVIWDRVGALLRSSPRKDP
jgi:phosphopantothenoylcysteine decarboxylase/phosphopantothenate--cysteine ligase